MDISKRGIDLIIGAEGKHKLLPDGRYKAYLDTLAKPPVWTVWAGLTKGVTVDTCLTEDECQKMFAKELAIYEDAVERLVTVALNQNQFDALVSFVYNCGPGALEESTLLKLLNQGKYDQVPAQLMRWTHAGGVEYAGLVTRRKAEGALFMEPMPGEQAAGRPAPTAETPDPAPQMPQRVEVKPVTPVGEVVAKSWTLRGAAAVIGGAILHGYETLTTVAVDAAHEAVNVTTTISPYQALFTKTNAELLALGAMLTGAVIVIARRLAAARDGKIG